MGMQPWSCARVSAAGCWQSARGRRRSGAGECASRGHRVPPGAAPCAARRSHPWPLLWGRARSCPGSAGLRAGWGLPVPCSCLTLGGGCVRAAVGLCVLPLQTSACSGGGSFSPFFILTAPVQIKRFQEPSCSAESRAGAVPAPALRPFPSTGDEPGSEAGCAGTVPGGGTAKSAARRALQSACSHLVPHPGACLARACSGGC